MTPLSGLGDFAANYDGFIIDLWGVIHDGVTPYADALDCLAQLRRRDKRVVLLSNAPRRAAVTIAALRRLGVHDPLYDAVVTSGEATHQALRTRPDAWFAALGNRIYHLGPPRDRSVFDGLGLIETADPAAASFVLNTGPDDARSPTDPAAFDDVLHACSAAALPMLCANPDLTVVRDGIAILCAGALAERYRAQGGDVRSIGKPDPAIYAGVLATLAVAPTRVLAIGDSLRTDIAGAAGVGLDALWILGGIHAQDSLTAAADEAAAAGLCPSAAMTRLIW
jgi:HAD superfamily hydrolase (TIGR01459 family)